MSSTADLVVTVPPPYARRLFVPAARTTLGVLTQLFVEATSNVVIAAPFMQPGHGLSAGPLAIALAAALERGVDVSIVGTEEGLATLTVTAPIDGRATLRTYVPAPHVAEPAHLGSHAKFCVADAAVAYVGSANFTGPGLETQLEIGMLVHGQAARLVFDFWELACDTGFFIPVATYRG